MTPTKRRCFSLVISFSIVVGLASALSGLDQDSNCTGRWIHIRRLPPRFNIDLLANCSDYPLLDDLCPYLANHGLGQKTHNKSRSWYRTDPQTLELIFHRRMLEYPCLTSDPASADAVFLPYYASLDALKYLYGSEVNSSADHGVELFNFLQSDRPEIWRRRAGHDHFLVMARQAWDFSQPIDNDPPVWGTSFLELPEWFNVTSLLPEARAWPWQEQAVPYPTSYHPANLALFESWCRRVRRSPRTSLMLFAGGGGSSPTPNIRRSIRLECDNTTATRSINSVYGYSYTKLCDVVDCGNGKCAHDPILYMRPMLQATFCLQPPGDTPTRRSTFDSILAGCIPVFFEDQSAKSQYKWHLPEDVYPEFSVFIPKEEVVYKGLKILDVLMEIPRDEVRRMREKVVELMHRVIYRKHGSSLGMRSMMDAFDIAVEGVLSRIKDRTSVDFGPQ
uniref:Exostosin GT47 domain-containing protein n=1 Tax=Kalanchoe fedtschenkoi TaxID=63787 RepID=A0A7N0U1B4_KALFE